MTVALILVPLLWQAARKPQTKCPRRFGGKGSGPRSASSQPKGCFGMRLLQRATNRAGQRPDRKIFILLIGFEALQDRAMWPMVPLAGIHQHGERMRHVLHICDLLLQLMQMGRKLGY